MMKGFTVLLVFFSAFSSWAEEVKAATKYDELPSTTYSNDAQNTNDVYRSVPDNKGNFSVQ